MVKITPERRRKEVFETIKTYASVEELLADWDGGAVKKINFPRDFQNVYYLHFGPVLGYLSEYGRKFGHILTLSEQKRVIKLTEELKEYINKKEEELIALFHLNSEKYLELELPVGFTLSISSHHSQVYTLEFVEEADV